MLFFLVKKGIVYSFIKYLCIYQMPIIQDYMGSYPPVTPYNYLTH